MLFKFRLILHFINNHFIEDLTNTIISHNYPTRLKLSNALKINLYKINTGQRSMMYAIVKLRNEYVPDYGSIDPKVVKTRLVERM